MPSVPDFLVRRIYKKGSLRETEIGISFDLKNILATGAIAGINFIKVNDEVYETTSIHIVTENISTSAGQINEKNPLLVKLNQEITCFLENAKGLKTGLNKIIVELISLDIGCVQVSLTEVI